MLLAGYSAQANFYQRIAVLTEVTATDTADMAISSTLVRYATLAFSNAKKDNFVACSKISIGSCGQKFSEVSFLGVISGISM